jgi:2'-hydroxyisoflavone reductase
VEILILGGTRFLGRGLATGALARGHRVTLFHRGLTAPALFPEAGHIHGDRDRDLALLRDRRWDAVFDTCGFVPRQVRAATEALSGRIGHYTFVSSISVYAEPLAPLSDESAPTATLADADTESVTGETYGALKAACERAAAAVLPGRVLNARAGLLVGPYDYTDRFPYWTRRIARGGDVLVPDALGRPLQLIDARDAAEWLIGMAERRASGTFNLTGPAEPLTLGGFLERCRAALASDACFVPVAESFLLERGVTPWTELPLWAPDGDGMMSVSLARARSQGLSHRALEETIRDTRLWQEHDAPRTPQASAATLPAPVSLAPAKESELLAEWARRR